MERQLDELAKLGTGMNETRASLVYGDVPAGLVALRADAAPCGPRTPGAVQLDDMEPGRADHIVMHAPDNTLERRFALAQALRVLAPGGALIAFAANNKGGMRLAKELTAMGCDVERWHKRHHQLVELKRGEGPVATESALSEGALRLLPDLQLLSQPGIFSWDRIDHGTQLLLDHLPALSGRGADLGCGLGILARAVMARGEVSHMTLIDIDVRACRCAEQNVGGDNVRVVWADVRKGRDLPSGLDFIVTNPPWHTGGQQDEALGQTFLRACAQMLRAGGELWLTANRQLAYEQVLQHTFAGTEMIVEAGGYKIIRAWTAERGRSGQGR